MEEDNNPTKAASDTPKVASVGETVHPGQKPATSPSPIEKVKTEEPRAETADSNHDDANSAEPEFSYEKPKPSKKGLVKSILLVLVGMLLMALGAFGGYTQQHRIISQKQDEIKKLQAEVANPIISTSSSSTQTTATVPVGFVQYENKDYGFKFAYPKEWGDVVVSTQGNFLTGKFTTNSKVVFGGAKFDTPPAGRGVDYSIITGYIRQGQDFFRRTLSEVSEGGAKRSFTFIKATGTGTKEIKAVNTNVLLIDASADKLDGPHYDATININDPSINAITFKESDTSPQALKQFQQMLATFELTK